MSRAGARVIRDAKPKREEALALSQWAGAHTPKAKAIKRRREKSERERVRAAERYQAEPEKFRARRRIANIRPAMRVRQRNRWRQKYIDHREAIIVANSGRSKQRWKNATPELREKIRAQRRKASKKRRAALSILRAVLKILDAKTQEQK